MHWRTQGPLTRAHDPLEQLKPKIRIKKGSAKLPKFELTLTSFCYLFLVLHKKGVCVPNACSTHDHLTDFSDTHVRTFSVFLMLSSS